MTTTANQTEATMTFNDMIAEGRESWFTVVDRKSGRSVTLNGQRVAYDSRKLAEKAARTLGWSDYTWARDGR